MFDQSCDPLKLGHTLVSSLSFADDLVIFSESHKGLQNALHKLHKYCSMMILYCLDYFTMF
jgi:hypothetical protein